MKESMMPSPEQLKKIQDDNMNEEQVEQSDIRETLKIAKEKFEKLDKDKMLSDGKNELLNFLQRQKEQRKERIGMGGTDRLDEACQILSAYAFDDVEAESYNLSNTLQRYINGDLDAQSVYKIGPIENIRSVMINNNLFRNKLTPSFEYYLNSLLAEMECVAKLSTHDQEKN